MAKRSYNIVSSGSGSKLNIVMDYADTAVAAKSDSVFRRAFKYFKSRKVQPELSSVKSVESCGTSCPLTCDPSDLTSFADSSQLFAPTCDWQLFRIDDVNGLFVLRSCFTRSGIYQLAKTSLLDFTQPPHRTNIDSFIEQYCSASGLSRSSYEILANERSLSRIRWSTMGYHHNWQTKVYSEDEKSPMPDLVASLCNVFSQVSVGYDFKAEAAICHFYRFDSTLSGHVDHSEPNKTAPLVAVSYGQSAVFLIGGETLDDPVTPCWLRSGDVMIMTGRSRHCYHAVPRIVQENKYVALEGEDTDY